ncbi:unnamed protein product, partial [Owenia fusiformis]
QDGGTFSKKLKLRAKEIKRKSTDHGEAEDGDGPPVKKSTGFGSFNPQKKLTMNIGGSNKAIKPIKMSLGSKTQEKTKETSQSRVNKTSLSVAKAFQDDSDDSEDEMPPEAKMRMRNLGKNTITPTGPNSFGKGNLGFCDRRKVIERELQKQMDDLADKDAD